MYSFIYNLYFLIKRRKKLNFIYKKIIGYIESYYNLYVVKKYKNGSEQQGVIVNNNNQKVIVSLTSFPKRIDTLWITIETLLRQTYKPDMIILWLAKSQFEGLDSLPNSLLKLQSRGLTIEFCDDLKSHKKYYYTMQKYPNDIVILADDDMFYPYDTIEKLMKMHNKYPNDICCMSGEIMKDDLFPSNWRNPLKNDNVEHTSNVQIFTGSGSLFPPHSLYKDVFQLSLIEKLCPYADDLWLTYMAKLNHTKVTCAKPLRAFPITIYGTSENSLWYINAEQGKNDEQWKAMLKYFKEEKENVEKDY